MIYKKLPCDSTDSIVQSKNCLAKETFLRYLILHIVCEIKLSDIRGTGRMRLLVKSCCLSMLFALYRKYNANETRSKKRGRFSMNPDEVQTQHDARYSSTIHI